MMKLTKPEDLSTLVSTAGEQEYPWQMVEVMMSGKHLIEKANAEDFQEMAEEFVHSVIQR